MLSHRADCGELACRLPACNSRGQPLGRGQAAHATSELAFVVTRTSCSTWACDMAAVQGKARERALRWLLVGCTSLRPHSQRAMAPSVATSESTDAINRIYHFARSL